MGKHLPNFYSNIKVKLKWQISIFGFEVPLAGAVGPRVYSRFLISYSFDR